MSIFDVRRDNLKRLLKEYGTNTALAGATIKSTSYISQLLGGASNPGETVSRGIEKTLGLPSGWLDQDRAEPPAVFSPEHWEMLDDEAPAIVITITKFALASTRAGEAALLHVFRTCTADARAFVLAVPQSQADGCRKV